MEELVENGGVTYTLKRNSGKTGYENTIEPRPGQCYAKVKVNGSQQVVPVTYCKTAKQAALRAAQCLANPYPIVKKDVYRAPKGQSAKVHGLCCMRS